MSGPPRVPGRRSAELAARPRTPPRSGRSGRQSPNGRPPRTTLNRRGRIVLALLAVLALIGIVAVWFLLSLFQPFHGDGSGKVSVTVPREAGVGPIAKVLEQRGVVSSKWFFEARARLSGKSGELKPGAYTLRRDMSYGAVLDALTAGPPQNLVTLVIPEGKSRREIARSIKSLKGDYMSATRRSRLLDPTRYGAKNAASLEGFLFPASYQLKRGASVDALVAKQLQTFKQRFATVDLAAARRANLTPYDVLIIASLVERETAAPQERGLIASVIYNRLKNGIPLGIDATTRFEFGNWTRPITQSQLASGSPYNTRNHQGLPPGPIGSPGLASIRAAARPPRTHYLYYVQDCNHPGRHVFVKTGGEFDAAVARYNQAREKAGGNAPKHC